MLALAKRVVYRAACRLLSLRALTFEGQLGGEGSEGEAGREVLTGQRG